MLTLIVTFMQEVSAPGFAAIVTGFSSPCLLPPRRDRQVFLHDLFFIRLEYEPCDDCDSEDEEDGENRVFHYWRRGTPAIFEVCTSPN